MRGGARLLRFTDDHVRLWTGTISIYLDAAANPALLDQMLAQLRGLTGSPGPGEPLPPPDFSACAES